MKGDRIICIQWNCFSEVVRDVTVKKLSTAENSHLQLARRVRFVSRPTWQRNAAAIEMHGAFVEIGSARQRRIERQMSQQPRCCGGARWINRVGGLSSVLINRPDLTVHVRRLGVIASSVDALRLNRIRPVESLRWFEQFIIIFRRISPKFPCPEIYTRPTSLQFVCLVWMPLRAARFLASVTTGDVRLRCPPHT